MALRRSSARLILVEGDAGSGKSVALRHVARNQLKRVKKSRRLSNKIPLYINLRELRRAVGEPINQELISHFIRRCITRVNRRDVDEYVDQQFENGLKEGTWLFLFDSFDELPDVLSSTEEDSTISEYAEAISNFCSGFNQCRAVIASRRYHGPKRVKNWPRFRIQPLSEKYKQAFVSRAGLEPQAKLLALDYIKNYSTRVDMRNMANNPMFLGLLCDYFRTHKSSPKNILNTIEAFIDSRLQRDRDRLLKRGVDTHDLRTAAERIAYCMAIQERLGLSPSRKDLRDALELHFPGSTKRLQVLLDALEYIKVARPGSEATIEERTFTFNHRRFQEHFATCVVQQEQERVPARVLLTNGIWRETAVVLLQTRDPKNVEYLLKEVGNLLDEIISSLPKFHNSGSDRFFWPDGSLHLLWILQDAYSGRIDELPIEITKQTSLLITSVCRTLDLVDRKWAFEVAGTLPETELLTVLRFAFVEEIRDMRDIAFSQTARLTEIPMDIIAAIYQTLAFRAVAGLLRREKWSILAFVERLRNAELRHTARVLLNIPIADLFLHVTGLCAALLISIGSGNGITYRRFALSSCMVLLSLGITHLYTRLARMSGDVPSGSSKVPLSLSLVFLSYLVLLRWMVLLFVIPYSGAWWLRFGIAYFVAALAPFSYWAANRGALRTGLLGIAMIPASPLLEFLLHPLRSLQRLSTLIRENWLIPSIFLVALAIGIVFPSMMRRLHVGTQLFSILFSTIVVLSIVSLAILGGRELYRWQTWIRSKPVSITPDKLLSDLSMFKLNYFRFKLLRHLLTRDILLRSLLSDNTTEELLHTFTLQIQQDRLKLRQSIQQRKNSLQIFRRFKLTPELHSSHSALFNVWYEDYLKTNHYGLSSWSPEVLNELTRLLEHARRQHEGTSAVSAQQRLTA